MRQHHTSFLAVGLALFGALALVVDPLGRGDAHGTPADGPAVFWTWDRLEPDTLASAWLLLRYCDPPPEVLLLPRGEHSPVGTPFDIPLVELSRTRTASTFHVLREHLGVDDPPVLVLERWVDEIETTGWEELPGEEASRLDHALRAVADGAERPEDALLTATTYLDRLHASLVPQE